MWRTAFSSSPKERPKSDAAPFQQVAHEFERKVDSMIKEVIQGVLPLQRASYECSVICFDKHGSDLDNIGKCIQECQAPAEVFGEKLKQEMQTLQNQITNCQQACHNKYSVEFAGATTPDAKTSIQSQMESCGSDCFSSCMPQVVEIKHRMLQLSNQQIQRTAAD